MTSHWNLYGASVIGKGHIKNNMPCQDAHALVKINRRWIIAVTSDGAGSYQNAQKGSQFIVKEIVKSFKKDIIGNKMFYKNSVSQQEEWRSFVLKLLRNSSNSLKDFSKSENLKFKSLSCTVNLALISSDLILTANIGDGRACYKTKNGKWNPMMVPFKGNQAGSTIFITTDWIWDQDQYINTQVIKDEAKAFSILTDGLERYSFLCYTKNDHGIFHDPNTPSSQFFDKNIEALEKLQKLKLSKRQIKSNLKNYLSNSKLFENELDDKTLLIGFIKS